MSAEYYRQVSGYRDGDRLDAETMNGPIVQLAQRTAWLKERLNTVASEQNFASMRLVDVGVDLSVEEGDCVYLNRDTGLFSKALAKVVVSSNPFSISDHSSYAVGIAVSVDEAVDSTHAIGTIAIGGLVSFPDVLAVERLMESGSSFRPGPYYLSSVEPGKLTADPKGPAVYIGTFMSDFANPVSVSDSDSAGGHIATSGTYAILAPQCKDLAEMHHHRSYALSMQAQGGATVDANGVVSIDGIAPNPIEGSVPPIRMFVSGVNTYVHEAMFAFQFVSVTNADPGVLSTAFGNDIATWSNDKIRIRYCGLTTASGMSVDIDGMVVPVVPDPDPDTGYCFFVIPNTGLKVTFVFNGCGPGMYSFGTMSSGHVSDPAFTTKTIRGWATIPGEDIEADPSLSNYSFKYEVGLDADLWSHFPPFPITGCSLSIDGLEALPEIFYGDAATYKVTDSGIYWKSNKLVDGVPFPVKDGNETISGGFDHGIFHLSSGKLPSSSFVTSIKAAQGSGIKIREEGTSKAANTGNLVIDAQIPVESTDPGLEGYRVPKKVNGNVLVFGPVVSKIIPGPGISVASRSGHRPNGCGDVMISASESGGGSFDDIVLHNAKQELIGAFPYVKLLGSSDVDSGFTMKMHIPVTADPSLRYGLVFYMSVFGVEGASASDAAYASAIDLRCSVLQDWYPQSDGLHNGRLDNVASFGTNSGLVVKLCEAGVDYSAFDPVFVHNDPVFAEDNGDSPGKTSYLAFPIGSSENALHPNATVAITVSRGKDAEYTGFTEYAAGLGFMNMAWKLVVLE